MNHNQEESRSFFVNRWQHPMCRWKKRILPIFWCFIISIFIVFITNSVILSRFLQKLSIDYPELFIQSFMCVSLASSFTFIGYYFCFWRQSRFLFIHSYVQRKKS